MVRIHREPPVEGPPGGAVAYTHFGARLARLDRFDSCTLYQFSAPVVQRTRIVGLHPTDAGSTPERRTIACEAAGLARRSSPRSITARRWFDSNILHHFDVEPMGDWQRWLMHSPLKRDQAGSIPASPTRFAGLADMDMHSPFKRDEVGSIPT